MKKNERQEIKKTLIDTSLYNFEGPLDDLIEVLMKAKEEAKREGFNVVIVNFYVDWGSDNCEYPSIDVEASRLESINEMKIRKAAEKVRKERESKEQYKSVMEDYKDHD